MERLGRLRMRVGALWGLCLVLFPHGLLAAGLWIDPSTVQVLPMTGRAWEGVLTAAEASLGRADVADQDSQHDTATLAVALVAVRTGRADLREKATQALLGAIGTEAGARWLAIGRNIGAYTIAADLLALYPDGDAQSSGTKIGGWLAQFLTRTLRENNGSRQVRLRESAWNSGSNAAAQEGFVQAALAAYTQRPDELAWAWDGFRRYCGDRTSPQRMRASDPSWQVSPDDPVGIQDAGVVKGGCRLDGAIGNDMARGGPYSCNPGYTQYPWVGLEGAVPAAWVLHRAGFPAFQVQRQALLRAFDYLWSLRVGTGDSRWFDGSRANEVIWLVNSVYGTRFLFNAPAGDGRTIGWTDWTFPLAGQIGARLRAPTHFRSLP